MKKIGIVILNYLNYNDSIECIHSLNDQQYQNYEVVIVDNCSANESISEIKKVIEKKANIHLLKSMDNLGYAKGNNIGIDFCLKELAIDNILIVNNDVIFSDENYLKELADLKVNKNVGAIGTQIIGSDGLNQNPIHTPTSKKRVVKDAIYFNLENYNITQLYRKIKNPSHLSEEESSNESSVKKQSETYFLHGSAIFLTDNFLQNIRGFYPETFLFYEENILAIMMNKLGLEMKYTDITSIYHKEDQSSALSFGNNAKLINKYLSSSILKALKVSFMGVKQIKKKVNGFNYEYEKK